MTELTKVIRVRGFTLRPIAATFDNATIIYNIFSADMKNLRFWMPNGDFKDATEVFMNLKRREKSTRQYMYGIYKNKELLGEIGLSDSSPQNKYGWVGYWLKKTARGSGIINKLLPTIEKLAFEDLGMNKLNLGCDVKNIASRKIAEKNGYTLDGIMRDERMWPDGSFHDECEYSKLKSEWLKENKNA